MYIVEYLNHAPITRSLTKPTSTRPPVADFKRMCFFSSWTSILGSRAKYTPEDIPVHLCSHVVRFVISQRIYNIYLKLIE